MLIGRVKRHQRDSPPKLGLSPQHAHKTGRAARTTQNRPRHLFALWGMPGGGGMRRFCCRFFFYLSLLLFFHFFLFIIPIPLPPSFFPSVFPYYFFLSFLSLTFRRNGERRIQDIFHFILFFVISLFLFLSTFFSYLLGYYLRLCYLNIFSSITSRLNGVDKTC